MKSLLIAVAIIANQPGYYTSLANHLCRWLRLESVPAKVTPSQSMSAALQNEKLAFLVGFESPTPAQMKTLRAFRARGGKLVVFHSSSPALGELMGVRPLGYKAAEYPGKWSRMDFSATMPITETSPIAPNFLFAPAPGSKGASFIRINPMSPLSPTAASMARTWLPACVSFKKVCIYGISFAVTGAARVP
jgi:hypothetical protein